MPVEVSVESPSKWAMPKSPSTAWPLPRGPPRNITFPGLTSRCSTPAACAVARADSTASPICATSSTGSVPRSSTSSCSVRGGSRSITIHGRPSASTTS